MQLIILINSFGKSIIEALLWFRYKLLLDPVKVSEAGVDFLLKKEFHSIEKGLSLRNSRPHFGISPRKNTEILLAKTRNEELRNFAKESLEEYANRSIKSHKRNGGSYVTSKNDFFQFKSSDNFLAGRRSVRQFEEKVITDLEVQRLMKLAVEAPSVCNRQHWKVIILTDKELINKVLTYQNGNRGFTDEIRNLAVICSDRAAFAELERSQLDFDCGIFTQQFLLALHSMEMVACPLNAAMSPKRTFGAHKALNLPHRFKIGVFVAFGYPCNEFSVAHSTRPDVSNFYELH